MTVFLGWVGRVQSGTINNAPAKPNANVNAFSCTRTAAETETETEGKGFVAPLQSEIVARLSQSDARRAKPNEFRAAKDQNQNTVCAQIKVQR